MAQGDFLMVLGGTYAKSGADMAVDQINAPISTIKEAEYRRGEKAVQVGAFPSGIVYKGIFVDGNTSYSGKLSHLIEFQIYQNGYWFTVSVKDSNGVYQSALQFDSSSISSDFWTRIYLPTFPVCGGATAVNLSIVFKIVDSSLPGSNVLYTYVSIDWETGELGSATYTPVYDTGVMSNYSLSYASAINGVGGPLMSDGVTYVTGWGWSSTMEVFAARDSASLFTLGVNSAGDTALIQIDVTTNFVGYVRVAYSINNAFGAIFYVDTTKIDLAGVAYIDSLGGGITLNRFPSVIRHYRAYAPPFYSEHFRGASRVFTYYLKNITSNPITVMSSFVKFPSNLAQTDTLLMSSLATTDEAAIVATTTLVSLNLISVPAGGWLKLVRTIKSPYTPPANGTVGSDQFKYG